MVMNSVKEHFPQALLLTTGEPVTSLVTFPSPTEEYQAAFVDCDAPFVHYFTFRDNVIAKRTVTRGEFWKLACSAAAHLAKYSIGQGSRVVHCFSANNLYDLVFRLALVLLGGSPVTINWQADDNERIVYKVAVTGARVCIYDGGFEKRVKELITDLPDVMFIPAEEIETEIIAFPEPYARVDYDDERIIVFTSGTTDKPKGVSLSHRSYLTNRLTYESYFQLSEQDALNLFLVNPLHHTNSTALSDWAMRRPKAEIYLLEYYTTRYWQVLTETVRDKEGMFVVPLVSRHIDFLDSLLEQGKLPVAEGVLKKVISRVDILIGSAPVGQKTIERIIKYTGKTPHVRFGSTESCLQVLAIPTTMSQDVVMESFRSGWSHSYQGKNIAGYYIGREHYPFTRVKLVRSTNPQDKECMVSCAMGEPGYLVTQGGNLFSGYVADEKATMAAFNDGWYTGLRDIAFALQNYDGDLDYYWVSRDSELLIRGGANYAYAQLADELIGFAMKSYQLAKEDLQIAVVGIRVKSEHEDSCCVTIDLSDSVSDQIKQQIEATFINKAIPLVSKGARPDYLRFAKIPRNFKGAIIYPKLKEEFEDYLSSSVWVNR